MTFDGVCTWPWTNQMSLLSGIFVFLPIAVNLFLIQHKASQRYLCGENHQLFGLVSPRRPVSQREEFLCRRNAMNGNASSRRNDPMWISVDGIPIVYSMKVTIEVISRSPTCVIPDSVESSRMIIIWIFSPLCVSTRTSRRRAPWLGGSSMHQNIRNLAKLSIKQVTNPRPNWSVTIDNDFDSLCPPLPPPPPLTVQWPWGGSRQTWSNLSLFMSIVPHIVRTVRWRRQQRNAGAQEELVAVSSFLFHLSDLSFIYDVWECIPSMN